MNDHKYRKKPIVIEAFRMTWHQQRSNELWPGWLNAAWEKDRCEEGALFHEPASDKFFISTLEGTLTVSDYDWIIRGVSGEIYPCKPDIFEATYEKVAEEEARSFLGEGE